MIGTPDPFYALVGRVCTTKRVDVDAIERMVAMVWRPMGGMRMTVVEENLFLFRFTNGLDLQHVLDEGSWGQDNRVFILERLQEDEVVDRGNLNTVCFLVQIWGVPPSRMTDRTARQISSLLGTVIEINNGQEGLRGRNCFVHE